MKAHFPGARALAVYVNSADEYCGDSLGDDYTKVVPLSPDVLARGFTGGQPAPGEGDHIPRAGFTVTPVEVPTAVFAPTDYSAPTNPKLEALEQALYQACSVAGGPKLAGSDAQDGAFVLALRQEIVPINLGDGRHLVLYKEGGFCGG